MITTPSGYVGDGFIADVDTKENAEFIVKACNHYNDMLKTLKDIAFFAENGLELYAKGKIDESKFKSLAGLVTEKAKAAIAKAENK